MKIDIRPKSWPSRPLAILAFLGLSVAAPAHGQGSNTGPGNPSILNAVQALQNLVTANNQQISQILQTLSTLKGDVHSLDNGAVLIDQATAIAGNVTPGDTPGFPVTITQPGSYRLASNLVVPNENTTAIVISADNVTVDLNGFTILGTTVCDSATIVCAPTGTGDGIDFRGRYAITIVNGTIKGMGHFGLNGYDGTTALGRVARVERVAAIGNGRVGISATNFAIVVGNIAFNNGSHGIYCGAVCIIQQNNSGDNGGDGVTTGESSYVAGNVFRRNAHFGLNAMLDTGYANNIFVRNSVGNISAATDLGQNFCEDATGQHPCP
jgi:hypothetical protein